jgi:hypothetical protein
VTRRLKKRHLKIQLFQKVFYRRRGEGFAYMESVYINLKRKIMYVQAQYFKMVFEDI